MRRTHHDALQHGLPADEGFLAALESWEQLDRCQKTQILLQTSHSHWMLLRGRTTPTTTPRLPQKVKNYARLEVISGTSIPLCINRLPEDLWSDSAWLGSIRDGRGKIKIFTTGGAEEHRGRLRFCLGSSGLGLLNHNQRA